MNTRVKLQEYIGYIRHDEEIRDSDEFDRDTADKIADGLEDILYPEIDFDNLTPKDETYHCDGCEMIDVRGLVTDEGKVICPNCNHTLSHRGWYQWS